MPAKKKAPRKKKVQPKLLVRDALREIGAPYGLEDGDVELSREESDGTLFYLSPSARRLFHVESIFVTTSAFIVVSPAEFLRLLDAAVKHNNQRKIGFNAKNK